MRLCPHCGKQRKDAAALRRHFEHDHPELYLPAPGVPPRPHEPVVRCYVRVSTDEQDNEHQRLRIRAHLGARGLSNVVWYEDTMTGTKAERPGLMRLQMDLQKGDLFVLLRADRLSRSLRDFVTVTEYVHDVGGELLCVEQPIDTTSPMGKAFWQMLGVFAELERALIVQRTKDAMKGLKAAGVPIGRHAAGCGAAFPCPTGIHGPDGMRIAGMGSKSTNYYQKKGGGVDARAANLALWKAAREGVGGERGTAPAAGPSPERGGPE